MINSIFFSFLYRQPIQSLIFVILILILYVSIHHYRWINDHVPFNQGTLLHSNSYQRIRSHIYNQNNQTMIEEYTVHDDDDDYENKSKAELFNDQVLNDKCEQEIPQLTQVLQTDQPIDDSITYIIYTTIK